MTVIQISALIGLIIGAALLYWTGYRGGLTDGRVEGEDQGKTKALDTTNTIIRELESELRFYQVDRWHLAKACEQLKAAQTFGADDRQTLLATAEKLRLAADTFQAMSSKGQAKQALELRDKVLVMATFLEPMAQERAA